MDKNRKKALEKLKLFLWNSNDRIFRNIKAYNASSLVNDNGFTAYNEDGIEIHIGKGWLNQPSIKICGLTKKEFKNLTDKNGHLKDLSNEVVRIKEKERREELKKKKEKFTKENLKVGDIVTLANGMKGEVCLSFIPIPGYNNKVRAELIIQVKANPFDYGLDVFREDLTSKINSEQDIIKVQREKEEYLLQEVLTKEEKEHLSEYIKPFRDKIKYIIKTSTTMDNCCYTAIAFINNSQLMFSVLLIDSDMYRNMKMGKKYTLDELKL